MFRTIKFLAIFLFTFFCLFLTSCTENSKSDKIMVLNYWVPFQGGDGTFMKNLVDEFNKTHTDIQVRVLNIPWGDYYTKLRTALVAASAPDVAICHGSIIPLMASTGSLEDIKKLSKGKNFPWNDFVKNPLDAANYNDIQYGIPLDTHGMVFYYNVDILRKCGILGPNESKLTFPNGVESFLKYMEIIKKKDPSIFPFGSESNGSAVEYWIWDSLYAQFKNTPDYVSAEKAEFDNRAGIESLKLMKTMVDKKYWPKGIANSGDLFKMHKTAFVIDGVWKMGDFERDKKLNFRVMPIPRLFDKRAAWGDSHTLIIPKQKKKKRMLAALKFIDWLTKNSASWAKAGHIPARKSVVSSEKFTELKYRKDYSALGELVLRIPKTENVSRASGEIARNIGLMMNNGVSVNETMKAMKKDVDRVLKY